MRTGKLAAVAAAVALLVPASAHAQLIKVTPKVGVHFRSSSVTQIQDDLGNTLDFEQLGSSSLAVGLNAEIGFPVLPFGLRGDVVLGTNTEAAVSDPGTQAELAELESTLLGASGSLVLRPLSILPFVDPYLLGGAGFTSAGYDASDVQDLSEDALPSDRNFALHAGVGSDLSLGGLNLQAEVTDYIWGFDTDLDVTHDVFATVGLGFSFP